MSKRHIPDRRSPVRKVAAARRLLYLNTERVNRTIARRAPRDRLDTMYALLEVQKLPRISATDNIAASTRSEATRFYASHPKLCSRWGFPWLEELKNKVSRKEIEYDHFT